MASGLSAPATPLGTVFPAPALTRRSQIARGLIDGGAGRSQGNAARQIAARGIREALSQPLRRSGLPVAARRTRRHRRGRVGRLQPFAKSAAYAQSGTGFCGSGLRNLDRLARRPRSHPGSATAPRRCGRAAAHPHHQRLGAQRAYLPRRDVEELAAGQARRARVHQNGTGGRHPRSLSADIGVRQANSSLQVLRLDLDGALPLAVQLLSELLARDRPTTG